MNVLVLDGIAQPKQTKKKPNKTDYMYKENEEIIKQSGLCNCLKLASE